MTDLVLLALLHLRIRLSLVLETGVPACILLASDTLLHYDLPNHLSKELLQEPQTYQRQ